MFQPSTASRRALRVASLASAVAATTLAGCSSEPDPNRYFNVSTDGPRLKACLAKLGPMVDEIQRKGLDKGEYRPGFAVTVKTVTFRYYQSLVWKYGHLQQYVGWDKLSPKQKTDLGPFLDCHEIDNFTRLRGSDRQRGCRNRTSATEEAATAIAGRCPGGRPKVPSRGGRGDPLRERTDNEAAASRVRAPHPEQQERCAD